jgi:hypothetical protein
MTAPRATAIVLAAACGCSFIARGAKGPVPERRPYRAELECSDWAAATGLDGVVALAAVAAGVAALWSQANDYPNSEHAGVGTMIAAATFTLGAPFLASAVYGGVLGSRCYRANERAPAITIGWYCTLASPEPGHSALDTCSVDRSSCEQLRTATGTACAIVPTAWCFDGDVGDRKLLRCAPSRAACDVQRQRVPATATPGPCVELASPRAARD